MTGYAEGSARDERSNRVRVVLGVILALLVLLLGVLAWFIVRVVQPAGSPKGGSLPRGLEWVRSIYGYGPRKDQQFTAGLQHVAIAADGTIWASDGPAKRVLGFNPDGSYKGILSAPGKMIRPAGLAIAENGDIFVGDFGAYQVVVFSPDGKLLRSWKTPPPYQLAVRNGRVVLATSEGFSVYTTDGEPVAKFGSRGKADDQVDLPQGVVIGDDGTVYVADTHQGRLKAFSPSGKLLWAGAVETGSAAPGGMPMQLPFGMTFDGAGRLILVDPFAFQIFVAEPGKKGAIVARYGDSGQRDGLFFYPTGIAYDSSRDWFAVADSANKRLQIVRIPGSSTFGVLQALRRAAVGPVWICAIPLALLLLALVVGMSGRRKEREHEVLDAPSTIADKN